MPWESVHTTSTGLLFGGPTMAVREFYALFDLRADKLNNEPDDHIGLELGFCRELLARALDAADADDLEASRHLLEAHDRFCREHLLQWAPEFFRQLHESATTRFYRGIALLGTGALERLGSLLEPDSH